ncbi:MAG: RluA family pseudouridine synthase [Henriciella sp.]|uniref:RluA family pseudouridine synthase n=1 Tax=Henriciella sp. TaxID=1968823 RepID=UPI003C72E9BE
MMQPVPEIDYNPDPDLDIEIVHVDDDILIANKPAGLLCVPGRGAARSVCLISLLKPEWGQLLAPHRLDMDTSGLTLLARNTGAHRALSKAFADRQVEKTYQALVEGEPDGETGLIDLPIGRNWDERPRRCIDHKAGKPSQTSWQKRRALNGGSLIELKPHTGRTHQLRLHCAAIGHPIIGDKLYGAGKPGERLCLHANALAFAHPVTGKRVDALSRVPFTPEGFVHK